MVSLLLDTDNEAAISRALDWANGEDQHIVSLADPDYPQTLLQIPDPPTLLYVRGRVKLLNRHVVAIVGSRNPTPQGLQNAENFASALAQAGFVVASGLALGIDAAAHTGALKTGDTIAFIGTGIDRVYPARNHELALKIGRQGAIVSEFPLGTPVIASNFPRRNRLISGMSLGVLIVEAATESGSLITARLASEQGREVFAIPGSIHSPQSKGCHKLIKDGAKLVETAQDVLEELNWPRTAPSKTSESPTENKTSDENLPSTATKNAVKNEKKRSPKTVSPLLDAMGFEPCGLDEMIARSGLSAEELSVELLRLELEGEIASLPSARYQRLKA